ncbi:hypothetical protein MKX01_013724 [Papaver californicum]|nr:hypothetical protein MKX01_013724 [Papaver californicum]
MPNTINFLSGRDYLGQGNHDSSNSELSKTIPRLAEYMEPLYETFFCPLTENIMNDPVTVASGVTYERREITEWFKKLGDTRGCCLNEAARIKVARAALSLCSSDIMIIEALKDLQYLFQKKPYTKVRVRRIRVLPLLSQLIVYKDKKVRCMTLATLLLLAENDDEAKNTIAKAKTITIIIMMLSKLSTSELLCEKIGSVVGAILMLITIKYNQSFDAFTAESANKILRNLEKSPKNIKCMAEMVSWTPSKPSYRRYVLCDFLRPEDMQMQMGAYVGVIVLRQDSEAYVAERASPNLIKMHSTVAKISPYQRNSNTLVEAGIVPVMIEEMFTRKIDSGRLNSKKESVAILANLLDSGILLENIKVNTHGHTMTSQYVVYNLIQLLRNSTSDEMSINLIKKFHCLIKSPKSTSTVVSAIKETEASYTLIEFLDSPFEELGIETLKLLLTLTTYMGHTVADRLCNTKGQPGNLIKIPPETTQLTEKFNLPLNLALLYTRRIPAVIQTINEIQISATRTSRFTNLYLEGLVGILVRFTTTLYERQILQLASGCNFTLVFRQLLMRATSDEVQRLSAIGLEKLSVQSITLSKPPQIKRTKFMKFRSRKRYRCVQFHKGVCSSETTFCLVDAKAVERLLACLYHENSEVVEAALSAVTTLLDDKVDVKMSVNMLNEMNIVQHVLSVLKGQKQQEGLWQKSFLIIEKFLLKGGNRSNSDISQDRFLPSTLVNAFQHGNELTRQMAEKILRHMKKIPYYSSEFV